MGARHIHDTLPDTQWQPVAQAPKLTCSRTAP